MQWPAWLRLATVAFLVWAVAGCGRTPLPPPGEGGELVVATRMSPGTYFIDPVGKPSGLEYDLATRFAQAQGWRVRFVLVENLQELFERLQNGEVHIAAAGLTSTEGRGHKYRFGPAYDEVTEQVICRKGDDLPRKPIELIGRRIEVVADSSHAEALWWQKLRQLRLEWTEVPAADEEELLDRVQSGLADCTLADSTSFEIARHFYPELTVAFDLGKPKKVVWMLPKRSDDALMAKIETFFEDLRRSGELKRLKERYYGHLQRLEEADVLGILERRLRLLPRLKRYFHQAQAETGLDWRLLAALAYQESQWDPNATSPTGVRGIMMLTEETADRLGVTNRLDPRESILAGARYMLMLKEALPDRIPEPDRTWMALAAYNIGPAHLEDARRLAQSLGKNPDAWSDVKEVLPLLARTHYQGRLKFGFARGGEARLLVQNVRIYYDILARFERPYQERIGLD